MVLIELGQKINGALRTFHSHTMVGDAEIDQLLKDISNALMQADVNLKIVMKLRQDVKNRIQLLETQHNGTFNRRKMIQTCIFEAIQGMLDSGTAPYVPKKGKSNVIMFIGMQGAGKTTSCTKYAAYYQKRGFKVGLICADTFRAGAYDQLKQNATKARVRFYGNLLSSDPVTLAHEGVSTLKSEGYDLIIVDTSGRHKQEEALFVEMQQIRDRVEPNDVVYVLDSTNGQTVQDQAQAFHSYVPVGSIILTKLDGHAKGGGALSAIAITKSPVIFIGTGEHYDEFEPFNPKSFVKRMLGFGDVEGLMNVIKGSGIDENSELYQRFAQGVFTLRDLYEHLENILKLGPVGKVMEMIPGLSMLKGREKESTAVLKIYLNILDSMSREELDAPNVKKVLTASRIQRIHRGSGRSIQEVHDLIKAYHKFEEMVKKMGKLNFQQLAKDPSALSMSSHTGQEQFTKLARAMDPNILKRLGGAGGLQSIMKQFNQLQ